METLDNHLNTTAKVHNLSSKVPLNGVELLIVDDCEENRFLFKHLMELKGALVTLAENGLQALHLTQKKSFDIVLMDIQMPVMDGYTAMTRLKSVDYQKPVIALTAYTRHEDLQQISESGFSAHIGKPFEISSLIELIQKFISKNQNSGAPVASQN